MKRKVFAFLVMILTLLTATLSTACVGSWIKVKPLEDYDFSIDNIVEVRISDAPMTVTLHGTIFGVKKGDRKEGDEAKSAIADAWSTLQSDAVLRKGKKLNIFIVTGGTYYYECIFADGSSVKMTKDVISNLYFNDGGCVRINEEDKLATFHNAFEQIRKKQNIVGHNSVNHDDNCDCDQPPTQE